MEPFKFVVCTRFLLWVKRIHSAALTPVSLKYILILPSHQRLYFPNGLFPSGSTNKAVYKFIFSPLIATCPSHLSPLISSPSWYLVKSANGAEFNYKVLFPNCLLFFFKSKNNNIYLRQLGCHPVAVVILHVNKTWNWLLLNLNREGYMRSM